MKTAIVIGATGLTGKLLTNILLADDRFEVVKIFTRRPTGLSHPKLKEYVIDFDQTSTWMDRVKGDVLFSALGTTLRKAGSKEAQYHVDYWYQYEFAKAAASNKVPVYALVSADGANPNSNFFYMRMKGELERDVLALKFPKTLIAQPGLISGKRTEKRPAEHIGLKIIRFFNRLGLFLRNKPIYASDIAQTLVNTSCTFSDGTYYLDSDKLRKLAFNPNRRK